MSTEKPRANLDRRRFLKAASVSPIALSGAAAAAEPQPSAPPAEAKKRSPPPSHAAEVTQRDPAHKQSTAGGDYIVDVLRSLGIEYVAAIPGNTFLGIQESVINYAMLTEPKITWLTVMHEEASVAFSHGYAKVAGKPMACIMHGAVGLQHGSMAIYNAWSDRAPVFMMIGGHRDARTRSVVDWQHSATDDAGLVRDFTKWDDSPNSLTAFSESAVRAYKFAMTPPYGPTLITVDRDLQEEPIHPGDAAPIPALPRIAAPQAESGAVRELARLLTSAEMPVIMCDRVARTPAGLAGMIELAETLQAPVVDGGGRMNFPWRHPLNQSQGAADVMAEADLVVGLEMTDFYGALSQPGGTFAGKKRVSLSALDLYMKGNYQYVERAAPVDLAIAADAEASLPALIDEVKRNIDATRRTALAARGERLAHGHAANLTRFRERAAVGWDASPITLPRLCAELYDQLRHEDWALVSGAVWQSFWPQKLWSADRHYQYIGDSGAYGVGYTTPASVGAALAHREHGRVVVSIVGDGDLMFGPGALWTAAHERIPLLYVVHNNRSYHTEAMQLHDIALRRERGRDRAHIGTAISDPNIDFSLLAKSLGMFSVGPVTNPADLTSAIKKSLAVVKRGEPALIDVVTQGK